MDVLLCRIRCHKTPGNKVVHEDHGRKRRKVGGLADQSTMGHLSLRLGEDWLEVLWLREGNQSSLG